MSLNNTQTIGIISTREKIINNEYKICRNYPYDQYIYYIEVPAANIIENELMRYLDIYRSKDFLGTKNEWIKFNLEKIIALLLLIAFNKPYDPMSIDSNGWAKNL